MSENKQYTYFISWVETLPFVDLNTFKSATVTAKSKITEANLKQSFDEFKSQLGDYPANITILSFILLD